MADTGRLIVLAGIDGSGKGTQAERLRERLHDDGRATAVFDFPQYETSFFGRMVARYLRGEFGHSTSVSPFLASLLYAGDRFEARDALRQALAAGKVIVCNRYVSANMAHQGGKIEGAEERRAFYAWVQEMEHEVFGLPRPDRCLLLDLPIAVACGLVETKSPRAYLQGEAKDIHEADDHHLAAARNAYLEIAAGPEWRVIPCAPEGEILPVGVVADKVWHAVGDLL